MFSASESFIAPEMMSYVTALHSGGDPIGQVSKSGKQAWKASHARLGALGTFRSESHARRAVLRAEGREVRFVRGYLAGTQIPVEQAVRKQATKAGA